MVDKKEIIMPDELHSLERWPYSHGVKVGTTLFIAGQVALDKEVDMLVRSGALNFGEVLEEEEARRLADEKDGTKKRRAKRLNDKEKRLANHWDMLGTDVKTYDDADEYGDDENVFGDGLDGNGGFLGSL